MHLVVRDVARLFNVSRKTVYPWIDQGILPTYRINNQYRLNQAELLEWAALQRDPIVEYPEVQNGAGAVVPVDLCVLGCPPHPVTIHDGLLRLLNKIPDARRRSSP